MDGEFCILTTFEHDRWILPPKRAPWRQGAFYCDYHTLPSNLSIPASFRIHLFADGILRCHCTTTISEHFADFASGFSFSSFPRRRWAMVGVICHRDKETASERGQITGGARRNGFLAIEGTNPGERLASDAKSTRGIGSGSCCVHVATAVARAISNISKEQE